MLQFNAPGLETPGIPLKNPERVSKEKRKQEVKRNNQEHQAVVRVQREKIRSGRKRIRGLKARVACECCVGRRGPDLSSGSTPAGGVRGRSHSAGRCGISKKSSDAAGRAAPGVRAAKSSESRKGE